MPAGGRERSRARQGTIGFLVSARRDAVVARSFFRKALSQPHTVNPRRITVGKNAACITKKMKEAGEL
jgi:transposase-like protein